MAGMGQLPAMFGEDLFPSDLGGPNPESTFGTDLMLYIHPDNRDEIGDPLAPWEGDEALPPQELELEEDGFKHLEDSDAALGEAADAAAADLDVQPGEAAQADGLVDAAVAQGIQAWMSKHPCTCGEDCLEKYPNALEIAASFEALSQIDRRTVITHILTAFSPPSGTLAGDLTAGGGASGSAGGIRPRKKARSDADMDDIGGAAAGASSSSTSTGGIAGLPARPAPMYMLFGKRLCKAAFQALTMSGEKIVKTALGLVGRLSSQEADHNRGRHRKGVPHLRTMSAVNFIRRVAQLEGYPCPVIRGYHRERPVILLPPQLSKMGVFRLYIQACAAGAAADPQSHLKTAAFLGAWQEKLPHIRVKRSSIDFCDICTRLTAFGEDAAESLALHRERASKERNVYTSNIVESRSPANGITHITAGFAEKVHLPMACAAAPGAHLASGLRLDMFGVSIDSEGLHYTFCLPEGHWPQQKSANTVISMLHHVLERTLPARQPDMGPRRILLSLDNSVSQSKNRWIIWYCAWRVLLDYEDTIVLTYMVPGHAKNFVDVNFAKIKQCMKEGKPRTPAQATQVIRGAFKNSHTVGAGDVRFFKWTSFLSLLFDKLIPNISKHHFFHFSSQTPGIVYFKRFSDEDESQLYLLKQTLRPEDVEQESAKIIEQVDPTVPLAAERRSQLEEDITNVLFKDSPHLIPQFFEGP
jgi:hypothetical protein